jgi:SAM-dependent methyltransferase
VRERLAIDVACGEGRDTRAILARRGWAVVAFDADETGVARTQASLAAHQRPRGRVGRLCFEDLALGAHDLPDRADLVNASFALPFCPPECFPRVWAWIMGVLAPGGRFAGQFFGDRDEWRAVRPKSHYTRAEVESLLAPFEIEWLDEVEKEGEDAMGGVKHHHVYHVVARIRSRP